MTEGIERTIALLQNAVEESEEMSVRKGTEYVEAEEFAVNMFRDAAKAFGVDLADPQWFAGAAAMLSFITMNAQAMPLADAIMDPFRNMALGALGRIYDNQIKEGVNVFDGK